MSRYYDPSTGRFINADMYMDTQTCTTISMNMYAYCENDPVMNYDTDGRKTASWCSGIIQRSYSRDQWNPYGGYFYYGKNVPRWCGYGRIYDHMSGLAFMDIKYHW